MNGPSRVDLSGIPDRLKKSPRWVCWRSVERGSKLTKVPVDPNTGANASCSDPKTWGAYAKAAALMNTGGVAGIGFQLGDGLVGIDLDKCRDEKTGKTENWARKIIKRFATYAEVSPSGTGVHILMEGVLPTGGRRKGRIEMYGDGRFFTMTGMRVDGTPPTVEARQRELLEFHAENFGGEQSTGASGRAVSALVDSRTPLTDDQIIARARKLRKFERLWNGDTTKYDSNSEADLALCGLLADWVDCEPDGIDRLFRKSGLFRAKWDEKRGNRTYGQLTIAKALSQPLRVQGQATISCDPLAIRNTDLGNARRLVSRYGENLRFCPASGKFFTWDGSRWESDTTGEVERLAKDSVQAMYSEASKLTDAESRSQLVKHALRSEAEPRIRAMIELAKTEPEIPVTTQELDSDPWILNCLNGTLDLRSGKLLSHQRDNLCTKQVPVDFDAHAKCPMWLAFLDRIMRGNPDLIAFLQRAIGYSLTGVTNEQVVFILYGTGANGKSTFVETIRKLLARYALQANFTSFLDTRNEGARNDLARLSGARFVTAVEAGEGRRLSETVIKQVTGGEPITARFLYREHFEFTPQFKLYLVANHKPRIVGTDEGIWRRIRLVPFTVTIPPEERDKQVPEKLQRELPGILAWAVRGCLAWQRDGLGEPSEVTNATAEYRREMDILADFLDEHCVIGKKFSIRAGVLYDTFKNWCERNGQEPTTQQKFGSTLRERGFQPDKKNGERVWLGLTRLMKGKPE